MKLQDLFEKNFNERAFELRLHIRRSLDIPYAVLAKDQRLISLRINKSKGDQVYLKMTPFSIVSDSPIVTVPTNGLEVFD